MADDCTTCECLITPNPDISGIGVRVSFYLQAILLGMKIIPKLQLPTLTFLVSALLAARSPEQAEITDALTTLVVTNLALCGKFTT